MSTRERLLSEASFCPAPSAAVGILAGLIDQDEIEKQLNCSGRSIDRYRAAGMPCIIFGKRVLFDPAAVREWIMSHQRRHDAPKRGRPRKQAA